MPGRACCVVGCFNNSTKLQAWNKTVCVIHEPLLHIDWPYGLHRVPGRAEDQDVRQKWMKHINRDGFKPNKNTVVNRLSISGGPNLKKTVWRICSKVFSTNVARQLNWCGRGDKRGMRKSNIGSLLTGKFYLFFQEIWYTKARKVIKDGGVFHYPATGFLEERLRNVRKRSNRGSTQQMPEATQSRRAYIPESTIPEERALQQKEWLKHNSEPFTQVQSYMKDTVLCRANWIRGNSSKDILEILTEYPHLTSPGMIAQDFQVLHGEAAPKLFETWIPEYAEKVLFLAKQDNKLPSLSVEDMTLDAKGELALKLLPTMVPQTVYRVGKKTIRHSIEESRTAFIHQMPFPLLNPVMQQVLLPLSPAEGVRFRRESDVDAYPLYTNTAKHGMMPGRACCVVGCFNNSTKLQAWNKTVCVIHEPLLHIDWPYGLHRVPGRAEDQDVRQKWMKHINRDGFKPNKNTVVTPARPPPKRRCLQPLHQNSTTEPEAMETDVDVGNLENVPLQTCDVGTQWPDHRAQLQFQLR
ncbi:hypothetical protein DPX16_17844 [Anabarilius grahami]|uniref:THAP-type domain-containing protein n=1 Tax=Anabarilius grahami TaxID=495550 RepID=A0A3N0YGE0_ANAGA|nr:hypothetical protein DPX16_17844 [Anabarilius grahami]